MSPPLCAVKLGSVRYPARHTLEMLVLTGSPPVLWASTLYIGWGDVLAGYWYIGIVSVSHGTFTMFSTRETGDYAHRSPLEAIHV